MKETIKATELRIGNLYYSQAINNTSSGVEFVDTVTSANSTTIRDAEHYGKDWAGRPIYLTEEWLIKFGFGKHSRENSTIINYSIVKDNWDYFTVFAIDIKKGLGFAGCKYKVKYVHQLQNLYFALTGEELTFTP